jgi:hypothetical protein
MRQINHNQTPRSPSLLTRNPHTIPPNVNIRIQYIHIINTDVHRAIRLVAREAPGRGERCADILHEAMRWVWSLSGVNL